VRLSWELDGPKQEAELVRCTIARPNAWVAWARGRPRDALLESLLEVVCTGIEGYRRLTAHAIALPAPWIDPLAQRAAGLWRGILGLLPRTPQPCPAWLMDHGTPARRAQRPALQLLVVSSRRPTGDPGGS
jgi:cellulose synthase (UDP-forming)